MPRPGRDRLDCLIWATLAAAATWGITTIRASAAMNRLEAQTRKEIAYWQAETSRARVQAAQLARDNATWADAWQKGRDDIIAAIPLITKAHEGRPRLQSAASDGTDGI